MGAENLPAGVQLAPHEERRRSQRVILRVSVRLHVAIAGKPELITAFTANVNDHGALLISPESFQPNERFVLEHVHTRERMGCRVTRRSQPDIGGFQVAVEFDRPARGFWQITFPPTNWTAQEA